MSVRAETPHTSVDGLLSDIEEEDDIAAPSGAVVQGRLKNCEMLAELYKCFLNLDDNQGEHVVDLIKSHLSLFSDVLTLIY